jgi:sugar phosphate isomerase/epimerase
VNTHLGGILKISNSGFKTPSLKAATLRRVEESLNDIICWAEKKSVTISVENVPYPLEELDESYSPLVGVFPRDFVEIAKQVNSKKLGVTIDFCHLWITYKTLREFLAIRDSRSSFAGVSTDDYLGLTSYELDSIDSFVRDPFGCFLRPLGGKVVHFHLADSCGSYVPGRGIVSEGKALGEGDLDLNSLRKSLNVVEQCSDKMDRVMIVLEAKEVDLDKPVNSLKSLIRLNELLRSGIVP